MRAQRKIGGYAQLLDKRATTGLNENAPHADITHAIIGVAMRVHNALGPGHREEVYQQAMNRQLPEVGLAALDQVPVEVALRDGGLLVYYLDLLVEEKVIVELKALSHPVTNDDVAQVTDYQAATSCMVALLLNFGRTRLEFRRIFPPMKIAAHRRWLWTKPAGSL